jgi:hypothetical protein
MINSGIDSLYLHVSGSGDLPNTYDITNRDGTAMKGVELGSPRVIIEAQAGNVSLVTYRIHIKSGTVNFFLTDDSSDNSQMVG